MRNTILLTTMALIISCAPNPRRDLSSREKQTDLLWLYSQIDQNYAPLKYKEEKHGFDYEALKAETLEKATETQSNADFYLLVKKFVATFKDAHTSVQLIPSSLPARSKVAYLGFRGRRSGNNIEVTELLPTYKGGHFDIAVGDIITKINGKTVAEYMDSVILPYNDLGQRESNLTAYVNAIFTRSSLSGKIPTEDSITLSLEKPDTSTDTDIGESDENDVNVPDEGDVAVVVEETEGSNADNTADGMIEVEVTIPWIVKDLHAFQKEQNAAIAEQSEGVNVLSASKKLHIKCFNEKGQFDEKQCLDYKKFVRGHAGFNYWNSFEHRTEVFDWMISNVESDSVAAETPRETLEKTRYVAEPAMFIESAKTYTAYVTNYAGENGSKLIGVIYLDTFSPLAFNESAVVDEFKTTLNVFRSMGVKDVVIDTLDNGGGSLLLGMNLAQSLTARKIEMPKIEFRLSETWLDDFESAALFAPNDTLAELNRRVFNSMTDRLSSGAWLSDEYNTSKLMEKEPEPNLELSDYKFNYALLVNELCASMCDIYAGILKDNGVVRIFGSQTMGAGGNVVQHFAAPNSGFMISTTESLIKRADGSYIENNGIVPDQAIETHLYQSSKYAEVYEEALSYLSNN